MPAGKLYGWSSCKCEHARGVIVIHLVQNGIRQPNSVDAPAPLGGYGGGRVVEIFVLSFEETKVAAEHSRLQILLRKRLSPGRSIGAKQDSVLVTIEKFPRSAGLPAEFAQPRADFDVQIRPTIQPLPH